MLQISSNSLEHIRIRAAAAHHVDAAEVDYDLVRDVHHDREVLCNFDRHPLRFRKKRRAGVVQHEGHGGDDDNDDQSDEMGDLVAVARLRGRVGVGFGVGTGDRVGVGVESSFELGFVL